MQNLNDQLGQLLEKEMDRKDFLKHVGVGLVAMTGATAILKALNGANVPAGRVTAGYGLANYGAVKPKA